MAAASAASRAQRPTRCLPACEIARDVPSLQGDLDSTADKVTHLDRAVAARDEDFLPANRARVVRRSSVFGDRAKLPGRGRARERGQSGGGETADQWAISMRGPLGCAEEASAARC